MPAAHTPGPWSVGSHRSIQSPAGTICETYSHMGIEEADANERLIAAAPELLAALELLTDYAEKNGACVILQRALIAKVTGKDF